MSRCFCTWVCRVCTEDGRRIPLNWSPVPCAVTRRMLWGMLHLGAPSDRRSCHDEAVRASATALTELQLCYGPDAGAAAMRRLDEAVACFQRAVAIDTNGAEARSGPDIALTAIQRHGRAIGCY